MTFCVVKIGGSLIGVSRDIVRRLLLLSEDGSSFLVVPGGGPMADLVKKIYRRYGISEEAAHWMAILAMEEYAHFLADGTGASLTDEISRPASGVRILLPYRPLMKDDRGLLHSWDYTSDSVAAFAAARLSADFVKATDVEGVILNGGVEGEIDAESLIGRETCIDQGALRILRRSGNVCLVLDGRDPDRFIANLKIGRGGTLIRGRDPGRSGPDVRESLYPGIDQSR
ncbi:uridylate kinase [Methanocrinis sp.]|uniref:amino acid kinase family protein n=1 Tax=Methanocrinis sp. TaxID=3101522 RepID=UPI003D12ADA1